ELADLDAAPQGAAGAGLIRREPGAGVRPHARLPTEDSMLSLLAILLTPAMTTQPPAAGKAVTILARGAWPHQPAYQGAPPAAVVQQRASRSGRELAEVAGAHALPAVTRALGVKDIDFTRHMLLAVTGTRQPLVGVSGGGPPSAPSRVEVAGVVQGDAGKVM